MDEENVKTTTEEQPATAEAVNPLDPEGDGLEVGQTTADVHGDILAI